MASPRFEIVVSAENHGYVGWQAQLWHHACLVRLGRAPLVVVHGDEPALAQPYLDLIAHGGRVQRAPNYRTVKGVSYAARNTAATLLHAESDADYLVICDPDMLVAAPWPLERYALGARQASLDAVAYLDVDDDARPWLEPACRRARLSLRQLRRFRVSGGVPHIVPTGLQRDLGSTWLRLHDAFRPHDGPNTHPDVNPSQLPWSSLASMWSLLMALYKLGIEPVVTRFCMTNFQGNLDPRDDGFPDRPLLHYCYGDETFNKRSYFNHPGGRGRVWNARARAGTINRLVCDALRAAGEFYGYRKPPRPTNEPAPRRRTAPPDGDARDGAPPKPSGTGGRPLQPPAADRSSHKPAGRRKRR
jgi:hypothetical protein